tara:strand:- start:364 stop:1329 length:966 start_codon:yes stop_codon:yes gene_type:complete
MAFNVSGLVAYVEEQRAELQTATVAGAKMMQLVEVLDGVKGTEKLPQVANTIFFQSDACGFNASGDSTFSQRSLTVGDVKVDLEWCPKDLEKKYFGAQMRAGAKYDSVEPDAVFQVILDDVMDKIARDVDIAVWQGDTSTGTGNNQYWDGFIDAMDSNGIDANSTSIYDGSALTAINATTGQEMAYRLYTALAENNLTDHDDTIAFVGADAYAALQVSLIQGGSTYGTEINSGSGDPNVESMQGLTFPGTGMKFIPVVGLTGTDKVYAGRSSNFFIGVDGLNDAESFDVWYSKDDKKVKFSTEFKVGCQIAFPDEVAKIEI